VLWNGDLSTLLHLAATSISTSALRLIIFTFADFSVEQVHTNATTYAFLNRTNCSATIPPTGPSEPRPPVPVTYNRKTSRSFCATATKAFHGYAMLTVAVRIRTVIITVRIGVS
jgi:hypothetical protein